MPGLLELLGGLSAGANQYRASQRDEEQRQAENMLKMLAYGYQPVTPQFQRTQTASDYLGQMPALGPRPTGIPALANKPLSTTPRLERPQMVNKEGNTRIPGVVKGQGWWKQNKVPSEVKYTVTKEGKAVASDMLKAWATTPDKKAKIAKAKKQGYSDETIVSFLGLTNK